jgi:hypothetical protein
MSKEAKIMSIGVLGFLAFFAFHSIKTEYARIQSRVEVTQAKVDALADELRATSELMGDAINAIKKRFLALEAVSSEATESVNSLDDLAVSSVKDIPKQDVNSLSERTSSVPTIIMHSGHSCGPCNAWLSNEMPRWLQSGWKVEVIKELDSVRAWPWFEITDRDGKQFEVNGPLTNNNFNAARAGAK